MKLSKENLRRTTASWIYTSFVTLSLIAINILARPYDAARPDELFAILYLLTASFLMSIPQARIERGRLDLSAIAFGAAAILTNPIHATVIGIVASFRLARRDPCRIHAPGPTPLPGAES